MRDWALVYEPQPVRTDALLLAAALLLHLPLLTLHMTSPHKDRNAKQGRLHNIELIEELAKKRNEKPMALPPKVPDVKKIEDAMKKAAEIKERLLKRAVPPPAAPKPQIQQNLATPLDPSKIQMSLKQQLEQQKQQQLKDKSFMEKPGQLPGMAGPKEIKMGGGASSILMGAKPGMGPGGAGGGLKGKSGFAVSEKSMPTGIGGGDEIKMGGGAAIVVPVGSRGRADASILSPVASMKDKGSLGSKEGAGLPGAPGAGGSSGLALGPGGGGGSIAVAGGSRGPAMAPPPTMAASNKSFSEKPASSSEGGLKAPASALPTVAAIPRRPPAARPMFQITGPLEKRPIVSRVTPIYPDWAKAKGIEASVTLQCTVSPEGMVKSVIIVLRTSGYTQLDQIAMDALKQWKFAPLPADQYRDEVGAITFRFAVS